MKTAEQQYVCDNGHIHTKTELKNETGWGYDQDACPDCNDIMFTNLGEYKQHCQTVNDAYKINQASEGFQQWCDDDAEAEVKTYAKETGKSTDFDQVGTDDFYLWLYEKGLRM